MSRDFILIFSGGMVSLVTTLIVLFVVDYLYRREQLKPAKPELVRPVESLDPSTVLPAEIKSEPPHPPETKLVQVKDDTSI